MGSRMGYRVVMGLDCSHNAFHGAYSSFNRLRKYVLEPLGGSYPPHKDPSKDDGRWYIDDEKVPPELYKGFELFFNHSDCDGIFTPEEAGLVSKSFFWFLEQDFLDQKVNGHLANVGPTISSTIRKFAEGCKSACDANEELQFH